MPVAPRPKKAAKVHKKIGKKMTMGREVADDDMDYTKGIKAPKLDAKKRKMPNYR